MKRNNADLWMLELARSGKALKLVNQLIGSSTWETYKAAVNDGSAPTDYTVGTQLSDDWYADDSTSYTMPWDIVHYDSSGNAYLKSHYALPTAMAFDEPEALYVFDGTESAGTEYYILINVAYGDGWTAGDGIAFTLDTAPAAGDQFVLSTATSNANDPTHMPWTVYGAGSTTAKQTGTTTNSTSGTMLGETSATGIGYTNGSVNSPQRVVYGYNRWSQSAMRQWLNSRAAAGWWWEMQNIWDRPSSVASTIRGFMAGLPDDFLAQVERSTVTTARNTVEGADSTTETTSDFFWLPSLEEMYITPQLADVEGEGWDYYKALAAEAGLTGKFAQYQTYSNLISYNMASTSSPVGVRLRSAHRSNALNTWLIYSSGSVNGNYGASYALRACPACKILKSE